LGGESILSLAVDLTNRDLVYAATEISGSIKISTNGGGSWVDSYLPVTFYSLAASPLDPSVLYAGTSNGIYRYQSGTWSALGLSGQIVTSLAINPAQPGLIFAGTTSGAYYSVDGGLFWKYVNENLRNYTIQSISFDRTIPNLVYFSTSTHGIFLVSINF
jgi:ligand-binding sensor domain-containing protein